FRRGARPWTISLAADVAPLRHFRAQHLYMLFFHSARGRRPRHVRLSRRQAGPFAPLINIGIWRLPPTLSSRAERRRAQRDGVQSRDLAFLDAAALARGTARASSSHIPIKFSSIFSYPCSFAQKSSAAAAISSTTGSACPFFVRSTLLMYDLHASHASTRM